MWFTRSCRVKVAVRIAMGGNYAVSVFLGYSAAVSPIGFQMILIEGICVQCALLAPQQYSSPHLQGRNGGSDVRRVAPVWQAGSLV
jgi:hypothetical protein